MFSEYGPRQLNNEGKLDFVQESCVRAAQRTYIQRKGKDTNPQIVQMRVRGVLIEHWYYRSDDWIDQPFAAPLQHLQPYRGEAQYAFPGIYGEGTYEVDQNLMRYADSGFVLE